MEKMVVLSWSLSWVHGWGDGEDWVGSIFQILGLKGVILRHLGWFCGI